MLRLVLAFVTGVFLFLPKLGEDAQRGALWRVVQACVADHALIGAPFPCLAVETAGSIETGYVVLRAPFVKSHTIVAPTVATIGIEAPRLRGAGAPNYFQDAWTSRGYALQGLRRQPRRSDLALAVNSRVGRSQDQLHIHVDCIRQTVKERLARDRDRIAVGRWMRMRPMKVSPTYWATAIQGETLHDINIVDLVADGLKVPAEEMNEITVVVVGTDNVAGKPGFVVLVRKRVNAHDDGHGETLMDHSCQTFRSP